MRRFKIILRLSLIAAAISAMPLLLLANYALDSEVTEARTRYEVTADQLRETTESLEQTEARLKELTSSLDAVEREVRAQLQMVKPGEKLVIVEYE